MRTEETGILKLRLVCQLRRVLLSVAYLCLCVGPVDTDGEENGSIMTNPTARLQIAEITTLWKAPDNRLGARQARFNPEESRLAWIVSNGEIMLHDLPANKTETVWSPSGSGSVEEIVWSQAGDLAACIRQEEGQKVMRGIVVWSLRMPSRLLRNTTGAKTAAWRQDGKALAFATDDGLYYHDIDSELTTKLADAREGWRPKHAPAYEDLLFVDNMVAARISGSMRWIMVAKGVSPLDLGEWRGIAPEGSGPRVYMVPWLVGPTKIPRGAGVRWLDLRAVLPGEKTTNEKTPSPTQPVTYPVVPSTPGDPYWLVDIWDWHYPTTLRVSRDQKTVGFIGLRPDVLAENPWREMCLWEAPTDGSALPTAAVKLGPPFKRVDVGNTHVIGWRPSFENAVILVDLVGRRAWRLPDGLNLQRDNTDVAMDRLLIGAARGSNVVLIRLKE